MANPKNHIVSSAPKVLTIGPALPDGGTLTPSALMHDPDCPPILFPVDRAERAAKLGDGPWLDEPDRVEFRAHGYPCLMVRQRHGAWCGYVAVPPGHPLHGVGYDAAHDQCPEISVHGGLTYASKCEGDVCHVPPPGEPDDVWWFGFDHAHSGDYVPGIMARTRAPLFRDQVYRDVAYVNVGVVTFATQLAAAYGRCVAGRWSAPIDAVGEVTP